MHTVTQTAANGPGAAPIHLVDEATTGRRLPKAWPLLRAGLLLALGASVVNETIRAASVAMFAIPAVFEPLRLGSPALSTATAAIGATLLLLALCRLSRRPERVLWIVSAVVLAVSFIPVVALARDPAHIPGTTPAAIATLTLMHPVAFWIIVPGLLRAAHRTPAP